MKVLRLAQALRRIREETGVVSVEYATIGGGVVFGILGVIQIFTGAIGRVLTRLADALDILPIP